MILHYQKDGSIHMILNLKGKKIIKNFLTKEEFIFYLSYIQ